MLNIFPRVQRTNGHLQLFLIKVLWTLSMEGYDWKEFQLTDPKLPLEGNRQEARQETTWWEIWLTR